jgi:CheY-like chemotaxis protein
MSENQAEGTDEGGGDEPTVLVVDDEPDVTEVCGLWLGADYDVRKATGGEKALETIDEAVDVVLLDRLMPGIDGDEVLTRIRAEGYECRVAMVTAVDPDFDVLGMPFDAYLVKPVTEKDLLETVERLVELAGHDERVREFYRLAARRGALESMKTDRALAERDEYTDLVARMEEMRAELDEAIAGIDPDTFAALAGDKHADR